MELAPYKFWHDRRWGVQALIAQGQTAAAIRYAEDTRGLNQSDSQISGACEEVLLSQGLWREAYDRYALEANRQNTYVATFQAITSKYPQIARVEIPGWVAADRVKLDLLHAVLLEQCRMLGSRPYPYLLNRAHEIAVVGQEEKEQIEQLLALESRRQGEAVGNPSNKQVGKDSLAMGRKRYGK